jgi:23S rRNA (uracil1939-C5)-methyltransferase
MTTADGPKKGAVIDARVEKLAFGGAGIARVGGMAVFIERTLPGDLVRARIVKRKPQYAEARLMETLEPSPLRQPARCPVFGACGGCRWQDFPYEEQLRVKQSHVAEALRHIARQREPVIRDILPSPEPYNYRNKMEFSFGALEDGGLTVGLHRAGSFQQIVGVDECHIQAAALNAALAWLGGELNREAQREGPHFRPYDPRDHSGFLRHLIFRHSRTTGDLLVALLTASGGWKGAERFAAVLMERFPACRGFLWGLNDGHGDVARLERTMFQAGEDCIQERLGDKVFRVSSFSFFQTNTLGAKVLYDVVSDFAELSGVETVLDAYCGTGTIGIYLAGAAARVVGVEMVTEAVWDARHNAQVNGATNCTFLAGDMRATLQRMPDLLGDIRFDRVIVDPPRGGMDKHALKLLIGIGAPLVVYVSCNPATLARDIVVLSEAGYEVEDVQPVDMFPHTFHVESVLKLCHRA